jgi:predicted acyltransferase
MAETSTQDRLISLDVFRGMTIAGMVLVNNPGTWSAIYGPLKHAEWHGITPTDYIFPFFLFIVGVAIPIALSKRIAEGITRSVYTKIFTRAAAIFATGLAMSAVPLFVMGETTIPWPMKWIAALSIIAALFFLLVRKFKLAFALIGVWAFIVVGSYFGGYTIVPYNIAQMRIPGVLQRIAVCYLVVSIIFLHTNWKQQTAIGIGLLLIYWLLMTAVPVPGCEITTVDDKACNLAAWFDRTILTENHIWRAGKVFDPEGILSTIPAIVTTISGVLTGSWLTRKPKGESIKENADQVEGQSARDLDTQQSPLATATGLFFMGTVLLGLGWSWSLLFPLNKSLWTSSYVVYTSGLALLTLGFCYYVIDIKGYKRWAKPFVVFGVNALALFVFSGILARLMGMIRIPAADDKTISLQQWIFNNLFLSWAEPVNASLAYAVTYILFWLFLMWLLYRRRIFIKF